jgi:hypothetical protein
LVTQVEKYLSYNFGISKNEYFDIYASIDCAPIEGGRRHVTDIERPLNRQHGSHRAWRKPLRRMIAATLLATVTGASAQQMSLPGNFAVNSNGAATYDIAIAVPPGTAGMVPSLKLSYSSQNGNGILGVGWTLSGLPSVSRCAQTFAQDHVRGAVTFAATDRFCMDGQRLVAINGGGYGADGTEYRTEIDSYSRIISHGTTGTGLTWFEVHTKSGQIMQFGNTSNSLILTAANGTARNWALNRVSDTKGNYFTVTYVNNLSQINNVWTSEAYPSRIDYTGNSNTGQGTYNSVQFFYATRPDVINVYQAGILAQTTVQLTDIKTYAGATLVSDYKINYQQSLSTRASEIISVTACAADGSCLPATAVNWLTGGTAGTFTPITNATVSPKTTQNAFGIAIGATAVGGSYDYYTMVGDFNGDGLTDFALVGTKPPPASGTGIYAFLSNGDGTFRQVNSTINAGLGQPVSGNDYSSTGDFDGDGRSDFIFISGSTLMIYISNGDGTFSETITNDAFGTSTTVWVKTFSRTINTISTVGEPWESGTSAVVGDFNGDGKTDIGFAYQHTLYVLLSKGDGAVNESELLR